MTDDQSYTYEEGEGKGINLVFRNGAWRRENVDIVFTDAFTKWIEHNHDEWVKIRDNDKLYSGQKIWGDRGEVNLIKGVTRVRKLYPKINIKFGIRAKYRDFSF